ncbi:MAG TPA: von Willebrand factor type A domain-containing protein [Thermoanaerobaculia bacterium]|nr:von Willebrand factor type A domain-containing protein [Thermoanaerobaculia bacterium]
MSTWTERKIAHDLSERESIEPPEGLLEKIKSEIPPDLGSRLPAAALLEAQSGQVVAMPRRQRWLLAASLILMVGAGLFATVVMRQTAPMEEVAEESSAPASPPMAAAPAPQRAQPLAGPSGAAPAEPLEAEPAPVEQPLTEQDEEKQDLRSRGSIQNEAPEQSAKSEPEPAAAPAPPLEASRFKEKIEVAAKTPPLDERRISMGATVSQSELEAIPTARDPWAILQAPPGVMTDRTNVGGSESGQQSQYIGSGSGGDQAVWSLDGVVMTDMTFKSAGSHPFVDTTKDRLSTFGLDVDTASYTVARRYLREGHLPPREAIRVEEFLNYFSYGDPPPARGEFALRAEGAASIFTQEPRTYLLRFNLRAQEVKAEHRRPAILTFVVDISGSMDQGNRLGLVKRSLSLLLDQLRKDDKVGLVVYGAEARVLLEPTSDHELIRSAIERLVPDGATNAAAGIALGYDVAGRSFRLGALNRILLCSDGVANVGATGPEPILERIRRESKRGIELTTLGFGLGNYNDVLMERLADQGNGRYAYLDDLNEARRVLVEELTGTLQTIAEDAKVQVEFFPAAVARWRLIGYENRDIPDEKFRDNTVDAGEIGAGHSVTALYEVQLTPQAAGKIASLHLRFRVPITGQVRETVRDLRVSELVPDWKNASPGFRLASLVAEFAETLRGSSHAEDHRKILRRAERVVAEMAAQPRGADVAEFARLVAEAARIKEAAEK